MCQHMRQKSIGRNIKRNTQSHIGTSLVHLTREFAVCNVELTKHVTRWQCHFVQISRIPGAHDNAAIFWRILDFVNAVGQLIDTLVRIICMHVDIFGSKVSPLKAIDWSQIAHLPMR